MRKPRAKPWRQIWVRISYKVRLDPIEDTCCSPTCPHFKETDHRDRRNSNYGWTSAACYLSGKRRELRRSIYKKWHRTQTCINAETARLYLSKKENSDFVHAY